MCFIRKEKQTPPPKKKKGAPYYIRPAFFNFFSSSSIFFFRYFASFSADDRMPRFAEYLCDESANATTFVFRFITWIEADVVERKSPSKTFLAQPAPFLSADPEITKSAWLRSLTMIKGTFFLRSAAVR